jgi:hypothetical protein
LHNQRPILLRRSAKPGNDLHASQHHRADDKAQHQVDAGRQQRGDESRLFTCPLFNRMMKGRDAVR